jgi:hypothetical protein
VAAAAAAIMADGAILVGIMEVVLCPLRFLLEVLHLVVVALWFLLVEAAVEGLVALVLVDSRCSLPVLRRLRHRAWLELLLPVVLSSSLEGFCSKNSAIERGEFGWSGCGAWKKGTVSTVMRLGEGNFWNASGDFSLCLL